VNLPARLVIVKGTEYFDGKRSGYVDYPLTDCLQMIGRAGRPGFDTEGTAVVLVESSKKNFYKKFLYTPFPVESCLRERLCENLNAEIATGTVNSLLDAVGYLTWTFFARRVKANPSYYGAKSSTPMDVEEFLTTVATETLVLLKDQGCVEGDECDKVTTTVLGRAASDYYLSHKSPKQMQFGLQECARMILLERLSVKESKDISGEGKLRPYVQTQRLQELSIAWLLYTLCCTHEFDEIPVRHNEEFLNEELSDALMWGADTSALISLNGKRGYVGTEVYADSHTKAFLLVQAHIQKSKLPISDYVNDSKTVMDSIPRLLAAMQFIASHHIGIDGSFDVLCQLIQTAQTVTSRSTPQSNPATQLPGVHPGNLKELYEKTKGSSEKTQSEQQNSSNAYATFLWTLRQMSRQDAAGALKKCRKGNFKGGFRGILDTLYSMPLVTINHSKVYHEIDKTSGKSVGTLKLSLEIDCLQSQPTNQDNYATLYVVVGTYEKQKLLAHCDTSMSRKDCWTLEKQLQFDWKLANENGGQDGGHIIVRLLLDSVCGLDSEIVVKLN
jgi:hypothetical protein